MKTDDRPAARRVSRRTMLGRVAAVGLGAAFVPLAQACAPAAPTAKPAESKPAESKPAAQPTAAPAKPAEAAKPAAQATAAPAAQAKPADSKPAAKVTPTGTLTYAQQLLPITQDPHIEFVNSSFTYLYSLYDPITRVDEEGKLQPMLATSWKLENPTTWVFELRKGVKWHDGSPLTAKDVAWSIQRFMDPETKSPWRNVYAHIDSVSAPDEHTFKIVTKIPTVSMPYDVGRMFVLPKDVYEKVGKDGFFEKPVGSGPYKFVRQVKGEQLVMEASEDYYAGPPRIKSLVFKQVPDAATRVAELLAGTADVADAIPPSDIDRINASGSVSMLVFPTVRRVMIDFAILTTPELADKRVRQAIAYAIDRDALNQGVYNGHGGKQTGWLDRFSWGYNKSLQPYPYDPARSKALLAEAGFPNGMPLTYMMGKGRFLADEEIALAVTDYLNKAGFQVDLKIQEFAVFQAARARKEYKGIYMLSSGNSLGDPDQVFRSLHSKREGLYAVSPELDALIEKQMAEPDPAKRAEAVAAVDAYVHENVLSMNLMTVPGFYGVNKRVEGWKPSPYEIHTFYSTSVK